MLRTRSTRPQLSWSLCGSSWVARSCWPSLSCSLKVSCVLPFLWPSDSLVVSVIQLCHRIYVCCPLLLHGVRNGAIPSEVLCAAGCQDVVATVSIVVMQINVPLITMVPTEDMKRRCNALIEAVQLLPSTLDVHLGPVDRLLCSRKLAERKSAEAAVSGLLFTGCAHVCHFGSLTKSGLSVAQCHSCAS